MSTLISRLGRRFRDKPKLSTNLNLPALPNAREILEDMEGCQADDPIIALAAIIQKKGRQSSLLLDKDFLEDPFGGDGLGSRHHHLLTFLSPYQIIGGGGSSEKNSLEESSSLGGSEDKQQQHKRRGSLTLLRGGGTSTSSSSSSRGGKGKGMSAEEKEQLDSYNKLKQFLVLLEKSEEILEGLEPQFRRVEESLEEKRRQQLGEEEEVDENSSRIPSSEINCDNESLLNVKSENLEGGGDDDDGGEEEEDEEEIHPQRLSESSDVCSSPLL